MLIWPNFEKTTPRFSIHLNCSLIGLIYRLKHIKASLGAFVKKYIWPGSEIKLMTNSLMTNSEGPYKTKRNFTYNNQFIVPIGPFLTFFFKVGGI